MLHVNELSKPARGFTRYLAVKLTPTHYEKLQQVARVLGVTESAAMCAVLDAVTVDATPAADYTPTMQDVLQESE